MRLFKRKKYVFSAREQMAVSRALSEAKVPNKTACIVMHAVRRAHTDGKTIKMPPYHVGKVNW